MKGKNSKELNELENSYHKMTRSEKAAKKASNAKRKRVFLIVASIALAVCLLLGLGGFLLYNHYMENRTVQANITIAGIPVQGMTRKEVSEAISEAFLLSHRGKQMVIKIGQETVTLTADVTNVHLDADALAKAAVNLTTKYPQQEAFPFAEYVRMDEEKVMPLLQAVTEKLQSTLVQSSYEVTGTAPEKFDVVDETCNQQITIVLGTPGISVKPERIYEAILSAYAEGNFNFEFAFPVDQPEKLNLEAIFSEKCVAPVNAVMNPETFEISDESLGYGFDMDALSLALEEAQPGEKLVFDFIWLEPKDTKESLTNALFVDTLYEHNRRLECNQKQKLAYCL